MAEGLACGPQIHHVMDAVVSNPPLPPGIFQSLPSAIQKTTYQPGLQRKQSNNEFQGQHEPRKDNTIIKTLACTMTGWGQLPSRSFKKAYRRYKKIAVITMTFRFPPYYWNTKRKRSLVPFVHCLSPSTETEHSLWSPCHILVFQLYS